MAETTIPKEEIIDLARHAVADQLEIDMDQIASEFDFIKRLEEANKDPKAVVPHPDIMFYASAIPLAASIVQVYATEENYVKAIKWLEGKFPKARRPVSILTVLMLTHLVQRGVEWSKKEPKETQAAWAEIGRRVENLLVE